MPDKKRSSRRSAKSGKSSAVDSVIDTMAGKPSRKKGKQEESQQKKGGRKKKPTGEKPKGQKNSSFMPHEPRIRKKTRKTHRVVSVEGACDFCGHVCFTTQCGCNMAKDLNDKLVCGFCRNKRQKGSWPVGSGREEVVRRFILQQPAKNSTLASNSGFMVARQIVEQMKQLA